ncbi:unnamed protein product [Protopolystoma xenopodis]|uniref:Uncharacterized protein n=1 Tax=Protopolystoma xenopodis TaxID=117903 RepID=A0A3S5BJJ6_9PLAT|nr:unnamed protein product [Protopolystoma xenopodis]
MVDSTSDENFYDSVFCWVRHLEMAEKEINAHLNHNATDDSKLHTDSNQCLVLLQRSLDPVWVLIANCLLEQGLFFEVQVSTSLVLISLNLGFLHFRTIFECFYYFEN